MVMCVQLQLTSKINQPNLISAGIPWPANPWTGEPIPLSEDQDENSAPDGKSKNIP